MTTFDERERSYEAKFALDQELRFKAIARRDKLLGAWAAGQLGLSGAAEEEYTKSLLREEVNHPGGASIISKLAEDFKQKGLALGENEVRAKLVEFTAEIVKKIESGQ